MYVTRQELAGYVTIHYLVFITTPARPGGDTTLATTTTSTSITAESTTTAAATAITTVAVAATIALNLVETVVGVGSSTTLSWLRVVISPRLVVGRSCGGRFSGRLSGRLSLGGLLRCLNINPLLRDSQVVAGIPLALTSGVRSVVSDIGGWDAGSSNGLLRVSIGQGNVGTFLDLGKRGVCDGRVGLNWLLGLNLGLGWLGDSVRIGVSNGKLFDLGVCRMLVMIPGCQLAFFLGLLTGCLEGGIGDAARRLLHTVDQLQDSRNCILVARVDVK